MGTEVAGWDLEISREFSGDWRQFLPLGVSCAALATAGDVLTFAPEGWDREPLQDTAAMSISEARGMADLLADWHKAGVTIVTWNGLGFDFPVLAFECHSPTYERKLAEVALDHVDLWFNMLADKGYGIRLQKAAQGLGLAGKTEGMSGALAPVLWYSERDLTPEEDAAFHALRVNRSTVEARRLCIEYVGQDAVTTLQVHDKLLQERALWWITDAGKQCFKPWTPLVAGGRFETVRQALLKPLPNTSWMRNTPISRESAVGWALEALEGKDL